ncbi:MAG TPA: hypothetical protein VFT50_09945 [Baekduia sp.]|nr:hypothetical protein [Baekduia sp.]
MFSPTASPRPAQRSWRETVRRAVDLAVAFATLSDELPRRHADDLADHPHRLPLRAPSRARRPGAVAPRAHRCTTPLASRGRHRAHTSTVR